MVVALGILFWLGAYSMRVSVTLESYPSVYTQYHLMVDVISQLFKDLGRKHAWLFYLHVALQLTGLVLTAAGFALGYKAVGVGHFSSLHTLLGLIICILVVVQVAGGVLRPHRSEKAKVTMVRQLWALAHRALGVTIPVLAVVNMNAAKSLGQTSVSNGNINVFIHMALALLAIYAAWSVLDLVRYICCACGGKHSRETPAAYQMVEGKIGDTEAIHARAYGP
jgi:hypothetical protein